LEVTPPPLKLVDLLTYVASIGHHTKSSSQVLELLNGLLTVPQPLGTHGKPTVHIRPNLSKESKRDMGTMRAECKASYGVKHVPILSI